MVRLVVENSEKDLAKARALERVEAAFLEHTANLLRVVRGAGKPYLIGRQASELIKAMQDHWDAANCYPSSGELSDMLELRYRFEDQARDDDMFERAEHQVVRASLQIAASRLAEQHMHETRGRSDMHDAMRRIEDIRAENKRRMGKPPTKKALDAQRNELAEMMRKGAAKKPKTTND